MIVALILAAGISISLVSYINLAATNLRIAERAFYGNASLDIAESGVEHAMACFYDVTNSVPPATAWSGWTFSGSDCTRTFSGFAPGPNATGVVRVYVRNYALAAPPLIVAKATISPATGPSIEKFVEITARKRGLFSMGVVARDTISFSSSSEIDSWRSDPDSNAATPFVPWSKSIARAKATVATASGVNGAINLGGSGGVYGTVHTAGGTVGNSGSATLSDSVSDKSWDSALFHNDFSATFTLPVAPTSQDITHPITASPPAGTTFPRAGDVPASDGKYYYRFSASSRIFLNGSTNITVTDKCVWILGATAHVTNISTDSSCGIVITTGATLDIYAYGDISVGGSSFINQNADARSCNIYGINPAIGGQTISVGGSGKVNACFYTPNANFTFNSSSDVCGLLVANRVSLASSAKFHVDESILVEGGGAQVSLGIQVTKWKELQSAAERQVYSTELNF